AAWHLKFVNRPVLARQVHQAFDWVTGVQIEQVAHEQMARWAGNRLQASGGIHVIVLFGRS
ncbi:MAG TPA: hypothetical protein VHS80_15420, partial [Chthoniobacterales bacterium]|nr:hypothetical protein [Chthoniobacterales bacterium]